ncbi:MAG TPA: MFS transporter [Thermoleophilaceae bacterium]
MFAVPTPSRSAVQRLAAARLISVTGNVSASIALALLLYKRTGSAEWVGLALLIAFAVPGLFSLVSGVLSDRLDRRRLLIASDLSGALCFAGMALVHAPGLLLGLAFVAAAVSAPFLPASGAMVPALASADDLTWANSRVAAARTLGMLLGPAVAAGLVAVSSTSLVFVANAASFVFSAALIATLRGRFRPAAQEDGTPSGALEGIRIIAREPALRALVLGFICFDIGAGFALPGEVPIAREFGTGSTGYSALIVAWAVGGLLGARAAQTLYEGRDEPPVLIASAAALSLGFGAMAVAPAFALVLVGFALSGAGATVAGVGEDLLLQRRAADDVRGRVYAARIAAIYFSLSLPLAFAGLLVDAWGPRVVYGIAAGFALLAALALGALFVSPRLGEQPER